MKIVKPKDTTEGRLKLIVYGDSGVGKTVFASTAPEPLFLSAEAGLLSIKDKDGIDVIEVETWDDLQEAFDMLKNQPHEYQTVVLDSLTELQKKHQDTLLAASGHQRLSLQSWGDNISAIRKLIRAFRDLPLHVILIALASEQGDGDSTKPLTRIALNGKSLPNEVMGFFDLVGYMAMQENAKDDGEATIVRAIRFTPSETIAAKDRSGKLDVWEQPDFTALLEKVYGKQTTKTGGKK